MKTNLSTKVREQGKALLIAMFLSLVMSITIAGYLKHTNQQTYLNARSQVWNLSMTVTEGGIDEALEHLNSNTANLQVDGWNKSGNVYSVSRDLSPTARYKVSIDMTSGSSPIITAQSFVTFPTLAANSVARPLFAASGANISSTTSLSRAVRVTAGRSGMFQKAMVAKHQVDFNGNNVLTDSFNSTDPSHSTNGRYPSTEPSKLLDNGDVASNDSLVNVVNVGNANIYGHVATGPGGSVYVGSQGCVGTRSWQNNNNGIQPGYFTDDMNFTFPSVSLPYTTGLTPQPTVVYSTNYTTSSASNTTTSATYPSPVPATGVSTNVSYTTTSTKPSPIPYGMTTNVLTVVTQANSFPKTGTYTGTPVKVGNTSNWEYNKITGTNYTYPSFTYTWLNITILTNYTVASTSYDYLIQGGAANLAPIDYYVSSLPGGNILVRGNARLVVAGNLDVGGNNAQNQITLNTDAKLEMWVGGTSAKLSGNGVINPTGYAQNFIMWCTDSVTDMSLNGNGEFTGILIAPNASVRLNGGGKAVEDFIGSLLANNITLNGHFNFHYDEALKNFRSTGRYIVKQWDEIPLTAVPQ